MNYRKVNNITGWVAGAIAFIVYLMTMEPTVSFWDCGEFLSCAYKVEVGHSPGAPLFMLLQRLFGMFAGGSAMTAGPSPNAAKMINAFSALTSALTIVFLFWTITHISKKLVAPDDREEPDFNQKLILMGAGLVGALAYTFSDTFWFSAVEAEVYATSSFFTALVFWAILKWESVADNKYADRWLVFIAYMMGLSVGIHLLNLLTIPALAMVYYFKRYTPTIGGGVIAFFVGCILLALVQFGVIQGVPLMAFKFDYLFVNSFGLPVDSGSLFFLLAFIGALVFLLLFAKKKGYYLLHTGMLCLLFVVIGFSSYLAPLLRSRADVAIDMTNPDNADRFLSYVNREQFGTAPLLFGPDYNTPLDHYDESGKIYSVMQKDGKDYYETVGKKLKPVFDNSRIRFFPRIWDNNDPGHVNFYKSYLRLGEDEIPSAKDNFDFFFGYQVNWMWWRYFMWNYAGRENDIEGQGDPRFGNWISGIKPIDKMMGRGDIDKMGDGFSNSKARNELYFLPLILGLLGVVYHTNRHKKDALIVFLLFFFTGIAVVLYLNNTPLQPRERDYAYAGATYAFAIWIGMGVLMVNDLLQKAVKGSGGIFATIAICLAAVPALMARVEWDDHDRSMKTWARESARNTLESCEKNAILFTFGDNDTYPLWYLQEVEGVRQDIRVINLSLLGIDWYIDQLNYKINDADAVPMIWTKDKYIGDRRNGIGYYEDQKIPQDRFFNLLEICKFISSDDPANQKQTMGGESVNYLPTKNFLVNGLSKEQLVQQGLLPAGDTGKIINEMKFTFNKGAAYKDDIAVFNIVAGIAQGGWKRPIYFGGGLGDNYQGMQDYLKLEGIVYRLVPYKYPAAEPANRQELGFVDASKSFDLFMKYKFGGAESGKVFFEEKNKIMFIAYRNNAPRIAGELMKQGRQADAEKLMDYVDKNISQEAYPYNPYVINAGFEGSAYFMTLGYYQAGSKPKAKGVAMKLIKNLEADINWILTLNEGGKDEMTDELRRDYQIIGMMGNVATQNQDEATAKEIEQKMIGLKQKVDAAMGPQALQQQGMQ